MAKGNAVKKCLEAFWDKQMGASAGHALFPVGSALDSITAVRVLLDLEEITGAKKLPQTLVRKGGYQSKEDFVETLSKSVIDHCKSNGNGV